MNQGPVSCLPMNSKMSKVKKALDEARETQNRELDLVDKNVFSFDEMPGLRKYPINIVENTNWFCELIPYLVKISCKEMTNVEYMESSCRWCVCFVIF